MSLSNPGKILPFRAENIFVEAFVVCVLGTSADQVDLPAAVTDGPLGIVQDAASAVGDSIPVMVDGVTKVVANGAFSKGDLLAIAATTGRVDTVSGLDSSFNPEAAEKQQPIGIALEAATASGNIVSMLIRPLFFPWA